MDEIEQQPTEDLPREAAFASAEYADPATTQDPSALGADPELITHDSGATDEQIEDAADESDEEDGAMNGGPEESSIEDADDAAQSADDAGDVEVAGTEGE